MALKASAKAEAFFLLLAMVERVGEETPVASTPVPRYPDTHDEDTTGSRPCTCDLTRKFGPSYREIQAKTDNLEAKVLGPKTPETFIVNK
jgi:hypothetical protein